MMKSRLNPILWSSLVMVAAMTLTLFVAAHNKTFLIVNQDVFPSVKAGSVAPVTLYFFGVVVVMALVLFFIPLKWLKYVFKVLFTLMFAWGVLVVTDLSSPSYLNYALAAAAGIVWLFWARIWLHDILLLIALAAAGTVFGFMFSPWAFMIFMLIIAVYDLLAVRFGFMVWMADKLSETTSLPAFIFPKLIKDWRLKLSTVHFGELKEKASEEREYSILGGGDIGFPLMLTVAVFFASDLAGAVVVGIFALAGLICAFLIQIWWLKGKPMPALPPIAFLSLIGFLIATYFMS
jgi:presenilin-like A22 family membrane protease